MARRDKHSKLKPVVSPITLLLVGAAFIGLLLVIIFSIDTKKEKFNKSYGLDKDNAFVLIDFDKVTKKISEGSEVLLLVNITSNTTTNIANLLPEVDKAYRKVDNYENNDVSKKISEIYYVELSSIDEDFEKFLSTYKVKSKTSANYLLAFKEDKLVLEYNATKDQDEYSKDELSLLKRNLRIYFEELTDKLIIK